MGTPILRTPGLMKDVIEGRLIGSRPRGRRKAGMLDELKDRQSYEVLKRKAEDRNMWRNWKPRTCP